MLSSFGRYAMRRGFSMIAAAILTAGLGFGAYAQEEKAEDSISSAILELLTQNQETDTPKDDPAGTQNNDAGTQNNDAGTVYAEAEGDPLISRDGVEVHISGYETFDYSTSLYLYVYAANDTDHEFYIAVNNAVVNGVPVRSAGFSLDPDSEYGDDSKFIMLLESEEDPEGSGAQTHNPRQIEMDLNVYDFDDQDSRFTQHVFIDMTAFTGQGTDYADLYDSGTTDRDNTFDSNQNTTCAPAYTPASYDFYTLDIGSRGQEVTDLQQRLTDLGYLCDKVDGVFGKNTGTAVMSFKAQHGMDITSEATPEMQERLYSSTAEYYVEPYIPLVIGPQFRCEHSPYADMDHGNVWVQVVNRNMDRSVIGYTLYYYMEDVYGEHYIEPTTGVELTEKTTFQQTIQPGYIEYSEPIMIMPWNWTYRVYVGIQKIVFDDGEVREVDPDDITYFYLDIKS